MTRPLEMEDVLLKLRVVLRDFWDKTPAEIYNALTELKKEISERG